ncbi:AzlD domain-containing protein [bacterium]|nr:AzlD domain-containing protein [bacterium]
MLTEPLPFILLTALVAGGSFALRAVFILLAGRHEIPPRLLRALSFVPAAAFCALIVTTLHLNRIAVPGEGVWQRALAMLVAGAVALRTRSILWTIVSGMCSLWLISWLAGLI